MSPKDLLLKYKKVYHMGMAECNIITEVPKKLMDLDAKLGLNIFPK